MAQKKAVAAKAKKAANGVEKQVAKRGAKATKVQTEEEIVVAQSPAKKSRKLPVKDVPQSSEEESDAEEQNGDQAEDDSDSEAEEAEDYIDDEAEEDDEDDSDDDVEPGEVSKSGAAEEDEDSDDDNESPVEEPVVKKGKEAKSPGKSTAEETEENGGIPKIQVGRIPPGTPKNQTIYATNLPNEYKHKEVVAVFAKFGPISALHRVKTKEGVNSVIIAFDSPASAEAALQAKPKALTLEDNVLEVSQLRSKESLSERTVVVGLIGLKVTKEDVKAYFEKVASVESVTLSANRTNPVAFVRLSSVDDVPKAIKLDSTELFSRFITVRELTYKDNHPKTNETTIVVENLGKHESFSSEALEKIFKKFGEVDFVDIVCSKSVLAFVTFKHSEAATKVLTQLQGKTVNNVELKLTRFERNSAARAILVTNLSTDTTEGDLRDLFKESGEIESIQMLGFKAVVKFTDEDGFCKSFLANERILNNQPIFIEPNSFLKYRLMKKRAGTGHSYAPAKFQKNVNNNFGKKPFNKRPAQEYSRKPFVKRAKF